MLEAAAETPPTVTVTVLGAAQMEPEIGATVEMWEPDAEAEVEPETEATLAEAETDPETGATVEMWELDAEADAEVEPETGATLVE